MQICLSPEKTCRENRLAGRWSEYILLILLVGFENVKDEILQI